MAPRASRAGCFWATRHRLTLAALLAALAAPCGQAETHTFSGDNGQNVVAEILSVKDLAVVVKRTDGKTFSFDWPSLSAEDRNYVKQWQGANARERDAVATTESEIEISVTVQPALEGKISAPGAFIPRVDLSNREPRVNFPGLRGTLVLVGQAADNPQKFKVLAVEKFSGSLPAGKNFTFDGKACANAATQPGQPAYQYRGYFFVLQNSEGNIIQLRHAGPVKKTGAEVLQLAEGAVYLAHPQLGASQTHAKARARGNWSRLTRISSPRKAPTS